MRVCICVAQVFCEASDCENCENFSRLGVREQPLLSKYLSNRYFSLDNSLHFNSSGHPRSGHQWALWSERSCWPLSVADHHHRR